MSRFLTSPSAVVILLTAACAATDNEVPLTTDSGPNSVWTLDLVRTLPGQQGEYVRSIESNWASARNIGRTRGAVLSYHAFVALPDSARGWDVLLMTEYVDSTAYANREAIFAEIFASPEYVRVPSAVPSSEMRTFALGDLLVREFVSGSPE